MSAKSGEQEGFSKHSSSTGSKSSSFPTNRDSKQSRRFGNGSSGKVIVLKELGPDGLFGRLNDSDISEQTETSDMINIQPHLPVSWDHDNPGEEDEDQNRVPTEGLLR